MTKDEAIKKLRDLRVSDERILMQLPRSEAMKNEIVALDMAIKALEQQPSEDCVSRAEVIKVLDNHWLSGSCSRRIIDEQIDKVKALPLVVPTFPKNATNGGIIKAMFPNVVNSNLDLVDVLNNAKHWWNAPYKRGDENGSN